MKVIELKLHNYRNIEDMCINPSDEMNVICGENAQGKTNLLESIWLFTGAKSFRGAKDSEFIKFGENKAQLNLKFLSEGIEKEAAIEIEERKKCFLQGNLLKSPSGLAGSFNAIVFSPSDLSLLNDGPSVRRKFLDTAIGQLYPSYIEILRKYVRAVAQRNKIIKDLKYDSSLSILLEVFEKEIAEEGAKIINLRRKYINRINEFLPSVYNGISCGKETLDTEYICSCEGEKLLVELEKGRNEDMFKGSTSIGPHRDDLDFKINGISARSFGSQGQKRSVALSLKLAEAEVIKKIIGESPTFILDDIMSELDPNRQEFILNHIKGMQVFLSCCDPSNVSQLKAGKIFKVKNGGIE